MQSIDRPNTHMRDAVDTALRDLNDLSRHHVAAELLRWGVPLPVIARVLYEPARRRVTPSSPLPGA